MDVSPKEPGSDLDLKLELKLRRRSALLPWLVVCVALIGSSAFWRVVEKLIAGAG